MQGQKSKRLSICGLVISFVQIRPPREHDKDLSIWLRTKCVLASLMHFLQIFWGKVGAKLVERARWKGESWSQINGASLMEKGKLEPNQWGFFGFAWCVRVFVWVRADVCAVLLVILFRKERETVYYRIEQTYDVALHSRGHLIKFDARTCHFAQWKKITCARHFLHVHVFFKKNDVCTSFVFMDASKSAIKKLKRLHTSFFDAPVEIVTNWRIVSHVACSIISELCLQLSFCLQSRLLFSASRV